MKVKSRIITISLMALFIVQLSCHAQATCPNSQPKTDSPSKSDFKLDTILDQLEQAAAPLKTYQARLTLQQEELLLETITIRNGTLYYQADPDTIRARIQFLDFLQRDIDQEEPFPKPITFEEDYLFDGQWLTRRNSQNKTIQKYQITLEKPTQEAFQLGRIPFPLPCSLRKEDIITHFQITLIDPAEKDPKDTAHLQLTPRKESPYADEYIKMDLWLSNQIHLPVQIQYEKKDYERTTVQWDNPLINKKIDPKTFQLKPAGPDWHEPEIYLLEPAENTPTEQTN